MRNMTRLATSIFFFVALFAGTAEAQFRNAFRVEIPFDFHVGNHWCPAGEYVIAEAQPGVYSIRNEDTGARSYALAYPAERPDTGKPNRILFRRIGDQHFLSSVWREGRKLGAELPVSATQAEAMRNLDEGASQVAGR